MTDRNDLWPIPAERHDALARARRIAYWLSTANTSDQTHVEHVARKAQDLGEPWLATMLGLQPVATVTPLRTPHAPPTLRILTLDDPDDDHDHDDA